jgi:predicted RNA-binding protein with PIN domain
LPCADRAKTIVVFDARESPRGIPSEYEFQGIAVRFARDHDEADDLIEELIAAHASTSSLTVISSDTRLQKAARRRKAAFFDSRTWFDSLQAVEPAPTNELNLSDPEQNPDPERKKDERLDATEVAEWISKMGTEPPDDTAFKKKRR